MRSVLACLAVTSLCASACGGGESTDAGTAALDASHDAGRDLRRDLGHDLGFDAAPDADLPTCPALVVDPATLTTPADFFFALHLAGCVTSRDCGELRGCDPRPGPSPWPPTATLDVPMARECLRRLASRGCYDWLYQPEPAECWLAIRDPSQRADGSPCQIGSDCVSGICRTRYDPCGGFCAPPAALGDPCDFDYECVTGARCFGTACAATVSSGMPCDTAPCEVGLVCREDHLCGGLPGNGEPCLWGFECGPGTACDDLSFMSPAICRATVPVGSDCSAYSTYCATGTICDYRATTRCVPLVPPGCRCGPDAKCLSGSCTGGVCTLPPRVGEACDPTSPTGCEPGICLAGTCALLPDGGMGCTSDRDCEPGLVCHGGALTTPTRCGPPPTLGDDCAHATCADGLTCATDGGSSCVACPTSWDAAIPPPDFDAGVPDATVSD